VEDVNDDQIWFRGSWLTFCRLPGSTPANALFRQLQRLIIQTWAQADTDDLKRRLRSLVYGRSQHTVYECVVPLRMCITGN
jgi:hypothetical protein